MVDTLAYDSNTIAQWQKQDIEKRKKKKTKNKVFSLVGVKRHNLEETDKLKRQEKNLPKGHKSRLPGVNLHGKRPERPGSTFQ